MGEPSTCGEGVPPGVYGEEVALDQDFCGIPTEADLAEMVRQSAGDLMGGLLELTALDVAAIRLTATAGDFGDLYAISLYYVPKPVGGVEQAPILLGEAESATGFETEILLTSYELVDFLELVQANEANPAPGCPMLLAVVSGYAPGTPIVWSATVDLEAYARIGG